jgi:hypothetical protein
VGFDCGTYITIYNSLGQPLFAPVVGYIKKGEYNEATLPKGIYFCEMRINGLM